MNTERRFGLKTLVETGTYYGEMVAAMKSRFDRIYSIEYVPALAERATRKFARDEHVRIFCGDSRVVMPEVLALLQRSGTVLAGRRLLRLGWDAGATSSGFRRNWR